MAWGKETKAGFGWATLIVALFLASTWAMVVYRSLLLLIIPVLGYIGFVAWVNRVK